MRRHGGWTLWRAGSAHDGQLHAPGSLLVSLSGPRVQGQPTQGPGTAHVRRQAPRPMDRPWQRQRVQACAVEAAATLCRSVLAYACLLRCQSYCPMYIHGWAWRCPPARPLLPDRTCTSSCRASLLAAVEDVSELLVLADLLQRDLAVLQGKPQSPHFFGHARDASGKLLGSDTTIAARAQQAAQAAAAAAPGVMTPPPPPRVVPLKGAALKAAPGVVPPPSPAKAKSA